MYSSMWCSCTKVLWVIVGRLYQILRTKVFIHLGATRGRRYKMAAQNKEAAVWTDKQTDRQMWEKEATNNASSPAACKGQVWGNSESRWAGRQTNRLTSCMVEGGMENTKLGKGNSLTLHCVLKEYIIIVSLLKLKAETRVSFLFCYTDKQTDLFISFLGGLRQFVQHSITRRSICIQKIKRQN